MNIHFEILAIRQQVSILFTPFYAYWQNLPVSFKLPQYRRHENVGTSQEIHSTFITSNQTLYTMTKGNNILLAALGGAAVGAMVANYLSTEKGKQMLDSATNTIKDLSGKATQYAKENLGEVIRETKDSIGGVVKEKIAERVQR
jgi:hypothetical protein